MKKLLSTSLLLASLMTVPVAGQASETYTIDPTHTSVTWTINHFDFSHPWGKFSLITGTLTLDEQNPPNSQVTVTVPMKNLVTGFDKLDEHLKSNEFFDVATYPEATFASTKVTRTGDKTANVEGVLTMHGVSHPETLFVTLNKIGQNFMKKQTAGFSATTTVKRSDFGMNAYAPGLGDEVKLYIESESNL